MMKSEQLKLLSKKMVVNHDDFMVSLRKNLQVYLDEKNIALHDIAEKADISSETLKTIVYGDSKDCKVSTVIALAKALELSIDELVGAGTLQDEVRESIAITRNLPKQYVRFVRWAIRYHERMLSEKQVSEKAVTVMIAERNNEGNVLFTNNYEMLDISGIPELIRPKTFMGIKLPTDGYMPTYDEGDILLIANDRPAMPSETAVIMYGGFMWLAKRKIDIVDGKKTANYYSIRDGKFRVAEKDVDEVIGYVSFAWRK